MFALKAPNKTQPSGTIDRGCHNPAIQTIKDDKKCKLECTSDEACLLMSGASKDT